ncbi:cell division protein FtsQ [Pseudoduganella flava]|uniref:Cell division protein FtsQ n=1 Tax=Pseudoduganella flava TaxID=871742 RepID=A0A562Q5C9_9BURK|nr:cell division protein FtsQ/DivIB [Pseudoduganella flava]QGZ41295.1 FtsQ-type POTRA domain-containing protein [Pseudoduganella flava]TWI51236.1 cell division protein FtsQ [Pseudoduganella flava]
MWQDAKALNATANGIFAFVAAACFGAFVWWLAHRPVFDLRTIRVEPMVTSELRHVNLLTLKNGTQGRIRGNFFTANLESVRQVFESVPWVRRATVRREWPDQLIVEVEEHEALGTWGEDGRLLSVKGDVFTANLAEAEEDHELPQFSGPDGSEKEVLSRYAELRKWFAPARLIPEGLALSGRYAWTVTLNNGMSVALGREQTPTMLKERVERLVGIWPQLAARVQNIETIDMRYQNGLALSATGLKIPAEKAKK